MKSMKDIEILRDKLVNGENFALARFNDGEMAGVKGAGCVVARGDQHVNLALSQKLREALVYQDDDYWVGVPCGVCWPLHRALADSLVPNSYKHKTLAVVTTNRNWQYFVSEFNDVARTRPIVWVSGNDQVIENLAFYDNVEMSFKLPTQDSFAEYQSVIEQKWVDTFPSNSIVVLSCGPLSRILVYEWWKKRKDCTFLDVGSAFDPFTRGVRHKCHIWKNGKNQVRPCRECN